MKIVLAGGPCSGKSSVIEELFRRGHCVVREAAREVLEVRGERIVSADLQREISRKQVELERDLDEGLVFLDRGLVDVVAYSNYALGELPDDLKGLQFRGRYSKVFLLDRLPFQDDGLRVESGEEVAREIHEEIARAYENFGYEIERVPVMPIGERADYILKRCK